MRRLDFSQGRMQVYVGIHDRMTRRDCSRRSLSTIQPEPVRQVLPFSLELFTAVRSECHFQAPVPIGHALTHRNFTR